MKKITYFLYYCNFDYFFILGALCGAREISSKIIMKNSFIQGALGSLITTLGAIVVAVFGWLPSEIETQLSRLLIDEKVLEKELLKIKKDQASINYKKSREENTPVIIQHCLTIKKKILIDHHYATSELFDIHTRIINTSIYDKGKLHLIDLESQIGSEIDSIDFIQVINLSKLTFKKGQFSYPFGGEINFEYFKPNESIVVAKSIKLENGGYLYWNPKKSAYQSEFYDLKGMHLTSTGDYDYNYFNVCRGTPAFSPKNPEIIVTEAEIPKDNPSGISYAVYKFTKKGK